MVYYCKIVGPNLSGTFWTSQFQHENSLAKNYKIEKLSNELHFSGLVFGGEEGGGSNDHFMSWGDACKNSYLLFEVLVDLVAKVAVLSISFLDASYKWQIFCYHWDLFRTIRFFNLIESQTWWINSWIKHFFVQVFFTSLNGYTKYLLFRDKSC